MMTEPYWWDSAGPPQPTERRELPKEVDVLVVGAGLTGLSASRTLAKGGKSVLCVDAGPPGIGASSRNGGMIGGGHRVTADTMCARYGKQVAARLLRELHLDSTEFALSLMAEEKIDCDFSRTGRFVAQWAPAHYENSARDLDRLQSMVRIDAEMVPRNRQHEELTTDLYHGGVLYGLHGGLNPAKWLAGLLRAAESAGALVQSHSPVTDLHRTGSGFRAGIAGTSVRAGEVLIATNGYTAGQFGATGKRIFPVPSYIIVTEELGTNRVRSLFPKDRMIVETREKHCYYRPSPDGKRIVFGGRAALFQAPPWFFRRQLTGLLTGIFPELKGVAITHSWKGNTGFTFEMSPHVGKIDGLWHAMGYCGNGNSMAPYLGYKAASRILGDSNGETAFAETPLPDRWWFRGQPWFLIFVDAAFRGRDAWSGMRGRLAKRS